MVEEGGRVSMEAGVGRRVSKADTPLTCASFLFLPAYPASHSPDWAQFGKRLGRLNYMSGRPNGDLVWLRDPVTCWHWPSPPLHPSTHFLLSLPHCLCSVFLLCLSLCLSLPLTRVRSSVLSSSLFVIACYLPPSVLLLCSLPAVVFGVAVVSVRVGSLDTDVWPPSFSSFSFSLFSFILYSLFHRCNFFLIPFFFLIHHSL